MQQITLSLTESELYDLYALISFATVAVGASKYGKVSVPTEFGNVTLKLSLEQLKALDAVLSPRE